MVHPSVSRSYSKFIHSNIEANFGQTTTVLFDQLDRPTKTDKQIFFTLYFCNLFRWNLVSWFMLGKKQQNEFELQLFFDQLLLPTAQFCGHSELIELFSIILSIFQWHFGLLTLICCSYPHQTDSNYHHHHQKFDFFHNTKSHYLW